MARSDDFQHKGLVITANDSCHLYRVAAGGESRAAGQFAVPTKVRSVLTLLVAVAGILTGCTKKVIVPNVVQQDLEQAKTMLAAVPLKPGNISGTQGTGAYVVSQTPNAGQQVAANSTVDLAVETPVAVPDLTNSNIADAVNTLQGIGLKVALVKQSTAKSMFKGSKVVQQDPPANSLVHHDAVVTLTVTMPPPEFGMLLGLVSKDPSYGKLNPEYRQILDQFLGQKQ
jgi:hypothetical protein